MKKQNFGTYVLDGETRIPLSEDERKTMLWAGWKLDSEAQEDESDDGSDAQGEDLPEYDSPPQVPDLAGGK